MAIVGYIVQYEKDGDFTAYHGFVRLYHHFSSALAHAVDMYRTYLETTDGAIDFNFEVNQPIKRACDEQGSVVVFRSPEYLIWIDCVVDEN